MEKVQIFTPDAPTPIGPYSQAVKVGGTLYLSGQLGIDMSTGSLAPLIEEQTEFALRHLGAILSSEGLSYDNVVKTTVFLNSFGDFAAMNEVYQSFFKDGIPPARSCVEVEDLPKSALVEIEAVAVY